MDWAQARARWTAEVTEHTAAEPGRSFSEVTVQSRPAPLVSRADAQQWCALAAQAHSQNRNRLALSLDAHTLDPFWNGGGIR